MISFAELIALLVFTAPLTYLIVISFSSTSTSFLLRQIKVLWKTVVAVLLHLQFLIPFSAHILREETLFINHRPPLHPPPPQNLTQLRCSTYLVFLE